jgi:hypothetical protein
VEYVWNMGGIDVDYVVEYVWNMWWNMFWNICGMPASQPASQPAASPSQPARQPARQPASQPASLPASQAASQPASQPASQLAGCFLIVFWLFYGCFLVVFVCCWFVLVAFGPREAPRPPSLRCRARFARFDSLRSHSLAWFALRIYNCNNPRTRPQSSTQAPIIVLQGSLRTH